MKRRRTHLVWLVAATMLLGLLAACGGDGEEEPEDGTPSSTATAPAQGGEDGTPTATAPAQGGEGGDYFAGKDVRIVIPYNPGGSSAVLVPFFAQEMPKFIPGNPNMTSTHLTPIIAGYNFMQEAPKDGTQMMYSSAVPFAQQYTEGADFDVAGFEYIGGYTSGESVMFVNGDVPYDDFLAMADTTDFTLRLPIVSDPSEVSADDLGTMMAAEAFNVPLAMLPLSGASTGTPELLVAMERGDIHGQSAAAVYYTLTNLRPGWTADGTIKPFAFFGRQGQEMQANSEAPVTAPNITDAYLESDVDDASKEQWRAFVTPNLALGKHFLFPPDTDPAAVEAMRIGFERAMEDEAFVTELERLLGQESSVLPGREFQTILEESATAFAAQHDQFDALVQRLYDQYATQ
jgi:tripartite-type tricarboxylate transporter receptor subunit TctC